MRQVYETGPAGELKIQRDSETGLGYAGVKGCVIDTEEKCGAARDKTQETVNPQYWQGNPDIETRIHNKVQLAITGYQGAQGCVSASYWSGDEYKRETHWYGYTGSNGPIDALDANYLRPSDCDFATDATMAFPCRARLFCTKVC